jgi:SAM-dependent methyltransferase
MRDQRSHAVLDVTSRTRKAIMIERLLGLHTARDPLRVLDVGCGSGAISQHLATLPAHHEVHAVDTVDVWVVLDGYTFHLVDGTRLPFPRDAFDIVLSNHVIEHVGPITSQRSHLSELWRVLKPSGTGYLSVPNRWRLFEAHYRLLGLSLLPRRWRSPYVRLLGRGDEYDVEPLDATTIEKMLAEAGFVTSRLGVQAIRETLSSERGLSSIARLASRVPDRVLRRVEPLLPTLIYQLHKA